MWNWASQYLGSQFALHIWNALILACITAVTGFIAKFILQTPVRKLVVRTKTQFDDRILDVIIPRIKWLTIIIGLFLVVEELAKGIPRSDRTSLELIKYSEGFIYVISIIFITSLLIRLVEIVLRHIIDRYTSQTSPTLTTELFPILNRTTTILLVFISLVITLGHFGVDVSSLLVFLGGSSVALALAAQDTLANIIAGFVIMLDKPFRTGDRIKLPSGESGDIFEIGLRSTKILDFDNNVIVTPNSELTKARVINLSYPTNDIRVLVEVSVAYGTNIDQAKSIMVDLATKHPNVLKTPKPDAFLVELTDSACRLQLVGRTNEWKKKFSVETSLREQIYNSFQKEGIVPAYPQRVVHISQTQNYVNPKNT